MINIPLYEYLCKKCNHKFEKRQKMTDETIPKCPKCNGNCRKLISGTSFILKGGGWYSDGYSKGYDKKKEDK